MTRFIFLVPIAVLVAACAGTPRPAPVTLPPPAPPPVQRPAAPPQASNHVTVPQRVPSAGPLKSATVSAYADNEERDLRQNLRAFGANIARRGDAMVLNINNAMLFDGAGLSNGGNNLLARLAIVLRRYDHTAVNVAGYTDTVGAPDQNLAVSQKRARLVADTLGKFGVAGARLTAQGYGETNLKFRTGDDVKDPRNRRIEIRITPTPVG
jgi:outer membrane protein OmpA-like peptidoglycan-associated protein